MANFLVVFIFITSFCITSRALREISYKQPLDHLGFGNLSDTCFHQRVFIDDSYSSGGQTIQNGTPILVYFGGESSIDEMLQGAGILSLAASKFNAIIVYIEHRFYGKSVPLGSIDLALQDPEIRGTLTSVQSLADFADVIEAVKRNLSAPNSPVIVFGGSYSGMLVAWFRMKYPHIAIGALASSAPLLGCDDLPADQQYCSIASRDFKDENEDCYNMISRSWKMIDDIGSHQHGLDKLSKIFNTCSPTRSTTDLKNYLSGTYYFAAQYNGIFSRIQNMCDQIGEEHILEGIGRAVLLANMPTKVCNDLYAPSIPSLIDSNSSKAWNWQICSELIFRNDGCDKNTMFEAKEFSLSKYMVSCYEQYHVYGHQNWISSYYGGQDLKTSLKKFGSNIIFSNGLKDPYSGQSILEDVSETIVAVTTKEGSHCLDMSPITSDDPKWLKKQRAKELEILKKWIKEANSGHSTWAQKSLILVLIIYFLV